MNKPNKSLIAVVASDPTPSGYTQNIGLVGACLVVASDPTPSGYTIGVVLGCVG